MDRACHFAPFIVTSRYAFHSPKVSHIIFFINPAHIEGFVSLLCYLALNLRSVESWIDVQASKCRDEEEEEGGGITFFCLRNLKSCQIRKKNLPRVRPNIL